MQVVTENPISVGWLAGRVGAGMSLTLVLKGTFHLSPGQAAKPAEEPALVTGDLAFDTERGPTIKYPSDFVSFKPRTDILLVGSAHAPTGRPTADLRIAMRVGQWNKALQVRGDRFWKRRFLGWRIPSDPIEFTSMPVGYERAFGGRKFKQNPVGIGYDKKRLPNIESETRPIRNRRHRPAPASFSPISPDWEPRKSKVGSYRGRWLRERWPWFPENFDWTYFNAAPRDQQLDGYLRGDEEMEFHNLHSQHPIYRCRLPGLRLRALVQVETLDANLECREVTINLDTLWIDMDAEKLVLVWRGLTPVRSVKFKEVKKIVVLTEALDSPPKSEAEIRDWLQQRLRDEAGEELGTKPLAADPSRASMVKEKAELEKEFTALEQEFKSQTDQAGGQMIVRGIDPKLLDKPSPSESTGDIKAELSAQVAKLSQSHPEHASQFASSGKELDEIATMEQEFAALGAKEPVAPSRQSVLGAISDGKSLPGADLCGLDLSGLDLSGADFSGADFSGANLSTAKLVRTRFKGARLTRTNLSNADLSYAILDDTDLSQANVEGAKFVGVSVQDATFAKLQLPGADFSGCKGQHPNFAGSNLQGANFVQANLPEADFCGANLNAANFTEAHLPSADFGGALAIGINMEKANLTNLRAAEKSNFTGGTFRGVKGSKSIWQGSLLDRADFSRAFLARALFEDASVKEASFDCADLTQASFEDASAQRALLTNANLLRVTFVRANLTGASLNGSNLYEASFWETVLRDTTMQAANIKGTSLS